MARRGQGYCYLALFPNNERREIALTLGPRPDAGLVYRLKDFFHDHVDKYFIEVKKHNLLHIYRDEERASFDVYAPTIRSQLVIWIGKAVVGALDDDEDQRIQAMVDEKLKAALAQAKKDEAEERKRDRAAKREERDRKRVEAAVAQRRRAKEDAKKAKKADRNKSDLDDSSDSDSDDRRLHLGR